MWGREVFYGDTRKREETKKRHRDSGKTLLSILLLLVVAVGGYVIYMQANYYRIKDRTFLRWKTISRRRVAAGTSLHGNDLQYRVWRLRAGVYLFMDTGEMKTGRKPGRAGPGNRRGTCAAQHGRVGRSSAGIGQ